MPQVYNWQLGRAMEYPYEAGYPQLQSAFVINTHGCLGCQACTLACKSTWTFSKGQEAMWWNNVESKPYGSYPAQWDLKLLALLDQNNRGENVWTAKDDAPSTPYGKFEGKTIFERLPKMASPNRVLSYLPGEVDWQTANAREDVSGTFSHNPWFFYLPRLCNHCTYPACVASCSRTAVYKRPEDGVVLIDQKECRGYRRCLEACPYKKIMYRPATRLSEKCVGCYPRLEGVDSDQVPKTAACMAACLGRVRLQGFLRLNQEGLPIDEPDNPLYHLIAVARVALPLYPQFGTQSNGYYLPPLNAPLAFLEQMFGPGAKRAQQALAWPTRELLAVLTLFGRSDRILFKFKLERGQKIGERQVGAHTLELFDDLAIGLGRDGHELVRARTNQA